MKYTPILTLSCLLAACGSSSSPADQSDPSCKPGRVLDPMSGQCVEAAQDASFEDTMVPDATVYVPKYRGTLYGAYQLDAINSIVPSYLVTYDFQSNRLEQLVSEEGNIISLPSGAIHVDSATLSPDMSYLVASLTFEPNEKKVYLFNLHDGSNMFLSPSTGIARFVWGDNVTYYMSLSEADGHDENGYSFHTKIHQRKASDPSVSKLIVTDNGKFTMPLAFASDNYLTFLCLSKDEDPTNIHAEKEICTITPATNTDARGFTLNSYGLRGDISFADSSEMVIPSTNVSIAYIPCAKGEVRNYVCAFHVLESRSYPLEIVTQVDGLQAKTIIANPTSQYLILNNSQIFNLDEKVNEGEFIPQDMKFEGKPIDPSLELMWFDWREN